MAVDEGIPKARISREALSTTDPHTIADILERTQAAAEATAKSIEEDPKSLIYAWDAVEQVLTVTIDKGTDRFKLADSATGPYLQALDMSGPLVRWSYEAATKDEAQDAVDWALAKRDGASA